MVLFLFGYILAWRRWRYRQSDEETTAMLSGKGRGAVIAPTTPSKEKKKEKEREREKALEEAALEAFLRSINSTATLPGYVKGENYSSTRGIINQCLVSGAVLLLSAAAGNPIGLSAVLLPQLAVDNGTMHVDQEMGSWIASIHSAATPIGSFASGSMMDAVGRRRGLQVCVLPLLLGWIVIATATRPLVLLAGRVLCGISVGLMAATTQVYLGEIAEPKLRGVLIGAPMVAYSVGILYVFALGSALPWRLVAGLSMVLPACSLLALCFAPESPTWLARHGRLKEANASIACLRGEDTIGQRELHQIVRAKEKETLRGEDNISFFKTISRMPIVKVLVLINVFIMLQTISGTFLVVFYAVDIMASVAGDAVDSASAALATAVVRLIFTIIASYLLLVIGRRPLAIISGIGSGLSTLILGIFLFCSKGAEKGPYDIYIVAGCLFIFIGFNTLGFMLLPGLMISELLPAKVKGMCGGYIYTLFNLTLFLATKIFPSVKNFLGVEGVFIMFAFGSIAGTIFVFLMLPESKGKSLIQIEEYFQKPNFFWVTRERSQHSQAPSNRVNV